MMIWRKRLGSLNPEGGRSTLGNYYTLMTIAKHMFNKYGWTVVGTIVPTDKKSRADHDIPFLKFQMEQVIDYKENGTVRHLSRSRL